MPKSTAPAPPSHITIDDDALAEGFTQVPNWLHHQAHIPAQIRYLYVCLLSFAWGSKDHVYPGHDTLARDMGVTRFTIMRWLDDLKGFGLLSVRRRGLGLTNVYVLHLRVGAVVTSMQHADGTKLSPPEVGKRGHKKDEAQAYDIKGREAHNTRARPHPPAPHTEHAHPRGGSRRQRALGLLHPVRLQALCLLIRATGACRAARRPRGACHGRVLPIT